MDKPLRALTFTNPTMLFNVLDWALMDRSSHTSLIVLPPLMPTFPQQVQLFLHLQGNLSSNCSWLVSLPAWSKFENPLMDLEEAEV